MSAIELSQVATVSGLFSIRLPSFAKYDLVEGNSVMEIVLHPGCEPLYVKQHDFPLEAGSKGLSFAVEQFVRLGIKAVAPDVMVSPVQEAESKGAHYAQVVCTRPDGQRWIARAVARPGARYYFLLHSVGSVSHAKLVLAMFSEFRVLE